jgi:hypothetical protein
MAATSTTSPGVHRTDGDPGGGGRRDLALREVIACLAHPWLPAHHRWELHQFARYLSGMVPDPMPLGIPPGHGATSPVGARRPGAPGRGHPPLIGRVRQRSLLDWRVTLTVPAGPEG